MRELPLRLARGALSLIRRIPFLHRPVHGIAVALTHSRLGSRFIRAVIEPSYVQERSYARWIEANEPLTDGERAAIAAHIAAMTSPPLISVVMPAYETPETQLREAIETFRAQLYPHWELCVCDDASPSPHVWATLSEYAAKDARIKIVRRERNGHISAASNSALALATGEFVALADHDDLLSERALYEVAALIERHPDADIVYSDEDKIDDDGRRFEPYFKTDWDPELILSQNMVSHLGVYRRSLIEAVGGFREGFEGSQDYDLTLRVSERTEPSRIHHIPAVLYHWRQKGEAQSFSEAQMQRCADSARRAVAEHLARLGREAEVTDHDSLPGWLSVRRLPPTARPLVSVIVPTRDRAELLEACARGVLEATDYPALELLIVDNDSVQPETFALFERLKADPRVRIVPGPGAFNYSKLNNSAVREARGELLLLLNNDIEVGHATWLDEMVAQAVRPEVGAVGARLLFADGRVQHAGVALGIGGSPNPVAGHVGYGARRDDLGYYGHLAFPRSVSAVTAACLCLRKAVFEEVGGLNEDALAVAFNDVDLCLRIREAGYQIIWTPRAELFHHESASRGFDEDPVGKARFQREIEWMRARWGDLLDADPYYSPNFDRYTGDHRLGGQAAASDLHRPAGLQPGRDQRLMAED